MGWVRDGENLSFEEVADLGFVTAFGTVFQISSKTFL